MKFNLGEALAQATVETLILTHVRVSDCYHAASGGSSDDVEELVRRCPALLMLYVDYSNPNVVQLLKSAISIEMMHIVCNLPAEAFTFDPEDEDYYIARPICNILEGICGAIESAPQLLVLSLVQDHGFRDDDRCPIDDVLDCLERARRSTHRRDCNCFVLRDSLDDYEPDVDVIFDFWVLAASANVLGSLQTSVCGSWCPPSFEPRLFAAFISQIRSARNMKELEEVKPKFSDINQGKWPM